MAGTAGNQESIFTINNWYKALCSSGNSINSGKCKTIETIRIRFQSKITEQAQNQHLDFLIDPSFQEVYRLFVLSFKDVDHWKIYNKYFLPTVEIKD